MYDVFGYDKTTHLHIAAVVEEAKLDANLQMQKC